MNSSFQDKKNPRRFKFEILWVDLEGCMEVIKEGWDFKIQGQKCINWYKN